MLAQIILFVTDIDDELPARHIPPPLCSAELPVMVQLVTFDMPEELLKIPPPSYLAELPVIVQLVAVTWLYPSQYIPPPRPLIEALPVITEL